MARNIYIVDAYQVDGSGKYGHLTGYPKTFDSESYEGDVDKALRRATGAFADAWSGFCNVDNKQIQTVTLMDITGFQIDSKCIGAFPPEPAPEPETEQAE